MPRRARTQEVKDDSERYIEDTETWNLLVQSQDLLCGNCHCCRWGSTQLDDGFQQVVLPIDGLSLSGLRRLLWQLSGGGQEEA